MPDKKRQEYQQKIRTKIAEEKGTRSGKAIGRPAIPESKRLAIRETYMAGGKGLREVAQQFDVGVETVRRCSM